MGCRASGWSIATGDLEDWRNAGARPVGKVQWGGVQLSEAGEAEGEKMVVFGRYLASLENHVH